MKDLNTDFNQYAKDMYGLYGKIVHNQARRTPVPTIQAFHVNTTHNAHTYTLFSLNFFNSTNSRQ